MIPKCNVKLYIEEGDEKDENVVIFEDIEQKIAEQDERIENLMNYIFFEEVEDEGRERISSR